MNSRYAGAFFSIAAFFASLTLFAADKSTRPLPDPPQVLPSHGVTSLTLTAVETPEHHAALRYNGSSMLPTVRVWPGQQIKVTYVNDLPAHTMEQCALGTCTDMTNLHFHGLEVSPKAPQDDVLSMMAMPGQTLHYDVDLPANHPPGLFWIHTHPHGDSAQEDMDGMSLALIVDGIDRYVPQVRGLRERVLVIRTVDEEHAPRIAAALRENLDVPAKDCGSSGEVEDEFPTVNTQVRPTIAIAPGERQFWRIVNAQPNAYLDLQLDGSAFHVVALDGSPLAYSDPSRPIITMQHVFVPPAGRVEAIVTGPAAGTHAVLRTLCVNTGPSGDINSAAVLADIDSRRSMEPIQSVPISTVPPVYDRVNVSTIEHTHPSFTATFTEGHHRFYINGKIFHMDAKPIVTARVGTFTHWHIINRTHEMHPFHIHQVHFLTFAVDGRYVAHPVWLDTMNVPPDGSIDVVLDLTNPVIRGVGVFHCHILSHEDKGMMAKVWFK